MIVIESTLIAVLVKETGFNSAIKGYLPEFSRIIVNQALIVNELPEDYEKRISDRFFDLLKATEAQAKTDYEGILEKFELSA